VPITAAQPSKAIELVRGDDGMWCTDMQVQPNSALEFKLAIRRKGVSKVSYFARPLLFLATVTLAAQTPDF
jgi:hypothetical protein